MAKIQHSARPRNDQQEYLLEQTRQTFQQRLAGLLEVHQIIKAKTKEKGLWLDKDQADVIANWILDAVSGMAGEYEALHRTSQWMTRRIEHLEYVVHVYRTMKQLSL